MDIAQVRLETSVLFQTWTDTLPNINVILGGKRVNFAPSLDRM
jgi:hypothetical protein